MVQLPVEFMKAHRVCCAQRNVAASVQLQLEAAMESGEELIITEENKPEVRGDSMSKPAVIPPLLCPQIVTLVLLPPKKPMLSRTHCRAVTASYTPRLPPEGKPCHAYKQQIKTDQIIVVTQ